MHHAWTDSWAFWAGILSWMIGAFYAFSAWFRRPREGLVRLAPPPAPGRTRAIVPLASPASGRECVYYAERVESLDLLPPAGASFAGRREDDEDAVLDEVVGSSVADDLRHNDAVIAERECGVFLLEQPSETLLVWPAAGQVRFSEGWNARERDGRRISEKALRPGTVAAVAGPKGRYAEMMSDMAAAAADLPPDLLRALQTREDLRSLRCAWGRDIFVTEGVPDEAEQEAGFGLDALAAGVSFVFGALLLYLSATGFL